MRRYIGVLAELLLERRRRYVCLVAVALALVLCPKPSGLAQEQSPPTEGVESGNYNIKQAVEFGYRITDITGSQQVYKTFVNLQDGPRLLDYTIEMRSLNHAGSLFDNLFLTNFGYGGDPNNVTRLRMYKNKSYNFSGTFRRDSNFWNYNLLANPLNPAVTIPNSPASFSPVVTFSPHLTSLVRRMSDLNLTMLPQSRVRFRLGYSRNISEGPSFTTFHEGTDVLLFQPWKTTLNSYQIGVDFKILPRTDISYDQFLYYYKGDTTWLDRLTDFGTFRLSNGAPVDLGLIFNLAAGQPCSTPFVAPGVVVNPACNAYLAYSRAGRVRTSYPTEQLSFQSNYFKNLDISGRFGYSSSDNNVFGFNEFFQGLVTRTRQRQIAESGPASARRVSVTVDWGLTWRVTDKFRVVDTFRFNNFRVPGLLVFSAPSLFSTSLLVPPNTFAPGPSPPPNCPTITSPGCPQHNASSPADIIAGVSSRFLGQNSKVNTFQLEYDFTKRIGARLGYRIGHRNITERDTEAQDLLFFPTLPNRGACAGVPLQPDGSCRTSTLSSDSNTTIINEHSGLFGLWTRPTDQLRISFDLELLSADNTLTRISPRQLQHYKTRVIWKPLNWLSFGTAINVLERRNNVIDIFHQQHNRSYSFSFAAEPNERFGVDFGFDYNDIFSSTQICYALAGGPLPPGSTPCPVIGSTAPIKGISLYTDKTKFGYANLMWKPLKRVTTNLGFAISDVNGVTTFLSPNAPPGPLQFTYYKPYAGLAVELYKGLVWKTSWGFYDYTEKAPPGPTGLRDFRGNLVTLAVRYAF